MHGLSGVRVGFGQVTGIAQKIGERIQGIGNVAARRAGRFQSKRKGGAQFWLSRSIMAKGAFSDTAREQRRGLGICLPRRR